MSIPHVLTLFIPNLWGCTTTCTCMTESLSDFFSTKNGNTARLTCSLVTTHAPLIQTQGNFYDFPCLDWKYIIGSYTATYCVLSTSPPTPGCNALVHGYTKCQAENGEGSPSTHQWKSGTVCEAHFTTVIHGYHKVWKLISLVVLLFISRGTMLWHSYQKKKRKRRKHDRLCHESCRMEISEPSLPWFHHWTEEEEEEDDDRLLTSSSIDLDHRHFPISLNGVPAPNLPSPSENQVQ